MTAAIPIPRDALRQVCERYHVRRLALFGSVLTPGLRADGDVDVLVEFEPGRTPGLGFVRLQRELAALLGRRVDLHTRQSLSRYFRDQVAAAAEVTYER
ncbi:MAG: nucleotidyltransferase family protein [Candidatus Latescibacterota bacterium]